MPRRDAGGAAAFLAWTAGPRSQSASFRDPGTRWQDTPSGERPGWRERAAYLNGEEVFAVDYQVCRRCGLGWVEQLAAEQDFQRSG